MLSSDSSKLKAEEGTSMNRDANSSRYCSISESIAESCKEVKMMREGKKPKRSLDDLFSSMNGWENEEKEKIGGSALDDQNQCS